MASATFERSIFSERGFRYYYAGQALSYVGDGLRTIAIPLLVFKLTGSALSLGITYALEIVPFAVFGLVGGSLADRLDRRRLMIACDFVRFGVIALFATAYARGFISLNLLYAGIICLSVCAAVFLGGQASSIPFLLGKERAARAVAALIATEQGANLIGPPIGGALFSYVGPLPALVVNAVTYLTSQISLVAVPTLGPQSPGRMPSMRELGADIAEGFHFLWTDAAVRTVTFLSLGLNLFGMMAVAVYIPFLKLELGASDAQVGLALGLSALGAVTGSLVAGKFGRTWPFGKALSVAYLVDSITFLPVLVAHHLWIAALFWALANAVANFEITQIIGWRMRIIPEGRVGRVFGAVRLVALIGVLPGTIAGGYLADHFGARNPIIVSGIGYLVLALAAVMVPALRRDNR